jgi:tetratricopeptide (TPR) repeat protein
MRKMAIGIYILLWPLITMAHGMDAMEYYNLGIENRITYKKVEYFTKALELNPKLSDAYEKRGMLYYFLEKYDKMILDFENYIALVPSKAEAYCMLGLGYLKTGLYKAAISCLTRAIEMDSNLASAYTNRAEAYLLSGRYEEAIQDSTRAIKIWGDPITMSNAYRTRAKVFWKTGRSEDAYVENRKALKLDPKNWKIGSGKSWGGYVALKDISTMGLVYLVGIAFILIFRIRLRPPEKDE